MVTGKKRNKEIARARHITIFLIREMTEMSYKNISKLFDRDHSTVLASFNLITRENYLDKELNYEISELRKEILGN